MPGRPVTQLKRIANLVEWFSEIAADFDKILPPCYRFDGAVPTGDPRADAWAAADKAVITTAAALNKLESVLRTQAMLRAKPRGKSAVYVKVESATTDEVEVSG